MLDFLFGLICLLLFIQLFSKLIKALEQIGANLGAIAHALERGNSEAPAQSDPAG